MVVEQLVLMEMFGRQASRKTNFNYGDIKEKSSHLPRRKSVQTYILVTKLDSLMSALKIY